MRHVAAILLPFLAVAAIADAAPDPYATIPAGEFKSALRYEDAAAGARVAPFRLMRRPVTNADFRSFVRAHPDWERGRAPLALAEGRYLSHWAGSRDPGAGAGNQPVTWVSWFAAEAYCRAQSARLPSWLEWEYVAAADATRRDARADPEWRRQILDWYSRPSRGPLPDVGSVPANAYGVSDIHSLVWEWVDDASSLLVSSDSREQGAADKVRFCGAGALSTDDRDNYATLMRVAMLSSLGASDATSNLGFRCAQDLP